MQQQQPYQRDGSYWLAYQDDGEWYVVYYFNGIAKTDGRTVSVWRVPT